MGEGYFYMFLAIVFYPLAAVALAKIARKKGSMQVVLLRQLAIAIVGAPLLVIFRSESHIVVDQLLNIVITCGIGGTYVYLSFQSFHHLPVAISRMYSSISRGILAIGVGIVFFSEFLSVWQYIGIAIIIIGGSFLRPNSVNTSHLKKARPFFGFLIAIFCGFIYTISNYFYKLFSGQMNPFFAAYVLEVGVGIAVLILYLFSRKKKPFTVSKREVGTIFAVAPLVILASFGMAKALETLNFAIVNVLLGFVLVNSMVLSWLLLKERLSYKQVVIFLVMIAGVVFLKF